MREKRRPTLDELRTLPIDLWRLEAAQIAIEAWGHGIKEIEIEADGLIIDPEITPERVVELREKLQSATGSTAEEAAPTAA